MSQPGFREGRAAAPPSDPHPLAGDLPPPPARVEPVVVPRWVQLVLLPLALLGAWGLARAAGHVLLLFVIAGLIALLLNPFVTVLRRAGLPRGLSVLSVGLGLAFTLTGAGLLLSAPVSEQLQAVQRAVPEVIDSANAALVDAQEWLDARGLDVQVRDQGQTALEAAGDNLLEGSGDVVAFTRDLLRLLVEASLALILVLVIAIYMLLYGERIGAAVRAVVPRGDGSPEDDYPTRVQKAVFGYVRGQFLFSAIMGTSAGLMLYVSGSLGLFPDGREYAFFFGAWYGLAELIPYVGPAIGAAPPVLIAVFQNPLDAVWLVAMFVALQQIEGHIVAPQVFAHSLRINPLLVIAALLLGGQLYGIVGAFVALPIAAILRETVVYFRRHLVLEPWGTPAPSAIAGVGAAEPAPAASPPAVCPECGGPRSAGDAFCRSCGTELAPPDAAAAAASAGPG